MSRIQGDKPTEHGCPWPPGNWLYPHTPALHTHRCIWCDRPVGAEAA